MDVQDKTKRKTGKKGIVFSLFMAKTDQFLASGSSYTSKLRRLGIERSYCGRKRLKISTPVLKKNQRKLFSEGL
jgi:hypothetical protein